MDRSFIFALFMFLMAATFFIIVPKQQYKEFLTYGILFGGVADAIMATFFTLINCIQYKNMGPFNIFNIFPSWMPVTWTYMFGLYFYLLPVRRLILFPYLLGFAALTYVTGIVFQNLGLFEYTGTFIYAAPFVFLGWFGAATWFYLKDKGIKVV